MTASSSVIKHQQNLVPGLASRKWLQATQTRQRLFFVSVLLHTYRIMVARAGPPKGGPVSCNAGYANPVRAITMNWRSC
ncbi:TPA: ash family protein [Enterobacter cloacae]|nr:ash family protein [Enterobacter cloacae]